MEPGLLAGTQKWHRLYFGDEFCIHRLPDLSRLKEILSFAIEKKLPITFLTPVASDFGIDCCQVLFDYLAQHAPDTEIVVNDWGMMGVLKEKFPILPLSLGRLMNKGFKDPRIPLERIKMKNSRTMFISSTFDLEGFKQYAEALGIKRLERDLLPYDDKIMIDDAIAASIYFPYGYVTTGRICRIAALTGHENERFSILSRCAQVCEKMAFEMEHPDFTFQIFQSGNTVFYLYPVGVCQSLLVKEKTDSVRLIYQDFYTQHEALA